MRFACTITLGEKASTKEEDANQRKTENEPTGGDKRIAMLNFNALRTNRIKHAVPSYGSLSHVISSTAFHASKFNTKISFYDFKKIFLLRKLSF
ncbi:putative ubiquinol oxidase (non-electrogenic) [Arabidopsis thaliana]